MPDALQNAAKWSDGNSTKGSGLSVDGVELEWWIREIPNKENWLVNACATAHPWLCKQLSPFDKGAYDEEFVQTLASLKDDVPLFLSTLRVIDKHTSIAKRHPNGMSRFVLMGSLVAKDQIYKLLPRTTAAALVRGYVTARLGEADDVQFSDVMARYGEEVRSAAMEESILVQFETHAQVTCSKVDYISVSSILKNVNHIFET